VGVPLTFKTYAISYFTTYFKSFSNSSLDESDKTEVIVYKTSASTSTDDSKKEERKTTKAAEDNKVETKCSQPGPSVNVPRENPPTIQDDDIDDMLHSIQERNAPPERSSRSANPDPLANLPSVSSESALCYNFT